MFGTEVLSLWFFLSDTCKSIYVYIYAGIYKHLLLYVVLSKYKLIRFFEALSNNLGAICPSSSSSVEAPFPISYFISPTSCCYLPNPHNHLRMLYSFLWLLHAVYAQLGILSYIPSIRKHGGFVFLGLCYIVQYNLYRFCICLQISISLFPTDDWYQCSPWPCLRC